MHVEEYEFNKEGRVMVVTLDEREIAVRLFEALMGVEHESGDFEIACEAMERDAPDIADDMHRCAIAACEYFVERMNLAKREQVQ